MKSDVEKLLNISPDGDPFLKLFSSNGLMLLSGYNRVVFGSRGPYVEINECQIKTKNMHIPINQLYRLSDSRVYYVEFRSNCESNVMVYYQLRTVAYADYKLGMFYISPTDLYFLDGSPAMRTDTFNERYIDFFE